MKFACEHCGRAYVADEKVRGRAFKMKCKQCGQLIVVRAAPGSLQTPAAPPVPTMATPVPGELRTLELQEVTALTPLPDEVPRARSRAAASGGDPFATMAEEIRIELAGVPEAPPIAPTDPFGAMSSPSGAPVPKLSEAEEVFADLSRQMDATSGAHPLRTDGDSVKAHRQAPRAAASVPPEAPGRARAEPPRRRWVAAVVGLGLGVAAAVGAGTLVVGSGPAKSAAPDAAPVAAAPAPMPPTPPAPLVPSTPPSRAEPAAPPAPPGAEPAPARAEAPPPKPEPAPPRAEPAAPRVERKAPPRAAERKREKPALARKVAEARPAPPPQPPPAVVVTVPSRTPPPRPTAPVSEAPPPSTGSSDRPFNQAELEATISRNARSLEGCLAAARKEEPQLLDGHTINVTMTVNPNGRAMYPTLDDVELGGTALGSCLKREISRMTFPEFAGEAVRARIPVPLR